VDRVYNKLDFVIFGDSSEWGYWRWWTVPYGWLRTNWFGKIHIQKGYTYQDEILQTGFFSQFTKAPSNTYTGFSAARGMVSLEEVNRANN